MRKSRTGLLRYLYFSSLFDNSRRFTKLITYCYYLNTGTYSARVFVRVSFEATDSCQKKWQIFEVLCSLTYSVFPSRVSKMVVAAATKLIFHIAVHFRTSPVLYFSI
jgi:hypothetical protein